MEKDLSRIARYHAAVIALPVLQRQVFLLHCVEELEYPEIAARLGIRVRDVERVLAQTLVLIDRLLEDRSNMD